MRGIFNVHLYFMSFYGWLFPRRQNGFMQIVRIYFEAMKFLEITLIGDRKLIFVTFLLLSV